MEVSKRDKRLTEFAREMRKSPMPNERWLWNVVRNRRLGGWKFRRQCPVGPYIADFLCEGAHVIVELDGSSHDDRQDYDEARCAVLESLDYCVIRVGSKVLVRDGDDIPGLILESCEKSKNTPSPQPSPPT